MRAALIAVALLLPIAAQAQEPYPLTPDSEVQNVPHGTVEKTTLPPGEFYPGTPHTVSIYLPPNPSAEPLPYMVFLDGSGYLGGRMKAAMVFDNLIAKKQLPPMVGIFIDPGVLPAIRPDAQNRYERVFEYDSLSNRYVNFLMQEVIPFVEKRHALSKDPNAHAIGGTSTGAVGAFVAAWHRPDQFRRVLSLIGTYVAMKGADTLPELVRKTEPKPIRIWMQDGANDHITPDEPYGTFYAGTWPRANQMLFDALQFSGYDAKLTIGTGGHDTRQGSAELPDALRWLWRDYSAEHGIGTIEVHPPKAQSTAGFDKRGSIWSTVDAIDSWQSVAHDSLSDLVTLSATANGNLLVNDLAGNLYDIHGDTSQAIVKAPVATNFVAAADDGGWWEATVKRPRHFVLHKRDGSTQTIPDVEADQMIADGHGHLYFTEQMTTEIGMVDLHNTPPTPRYIDSIAMDERSALALSPDAAMLVVTDTRDRRQWSMQLQEDGTPANAEPFYRLEALDNVGGASSAAFDSLGQVYFATNIGVQIAEANGRIAMILNSPIPDQPIDTLTFGGPDHDWLYVTVQGKLFRRKMKTHAVSVDKPEKPPQPPL